MIRVFGLICKLNLINLSAYDAFQRAMSEGNINDSPYPFCCCAHPDWQKHASYERYLISFERGHSITYVIIVIRYKSPSCGHTHAILPEHLIPYSSYSLPFFLSVLRDYYTRPVTVEVLCSEYDISVSTLYAWHSLFLTYMKLWLGLLDDYVSSPDTFVSELSPIPSGQNLSGFFNSMRYLFLQSGHYSFRTALTIVSLSAFQHSVSVVTLLVMTITFGTMNSYPTG